MRCVYDSNVKLIQMSQTVYCKNTFQSLYKTFKIGMLFIIYHKYEDTYTCILPQYMQCDLQMNIISLF